MQIPYHVATAHEFLEAADREFEAGDFLQGPEKMWDAASHAVIAAAKQRDWRCNNHAAQKSVVRRLVQESGNTFLKMGFDDAETLHANFYAGFLSHDDFGDKRDNVRENVRESVYRVLDLVRSGNQ